MAASSSSNRKKTKPFFLHISVRSFTENQYLADTFAASTMRTVIVFSALLAICLAASIGPSYTSQKIRWCVISDAENAKCTKLTQSFATEGLKPDIECIQKYSRASCAVAIIKNEADIVVLDPREGFFANKKYTLVPLLAERYFDNYENAFSYKSVVVVRKSDDRIQKPEDMKGSKLCYPDIGTDKWIPQRSKLSKLGVLTPSGDCHSFLPTTSKFFSKACLPGATLPFYSRPGDDVSNLCELCAGDEQTKCTEDDPYAGEKGAFKCLLEKAGDVAALEHLTVQLETANETAEGRRQQDFELICYDGTRKPIDKFDECNWGVVPSWVLFGGNHLPKESQQAIKDLFLNLKDQKQLFQSEQFGGKDLLFRDSTKNLVDTKTDNFSEYTGSEFADDMESRLKDCSDTTQPSTIRWCTVSDQEFDKCTELEIFAPAYTIRPYVTCVKSKSTHDCLALIRDDKADVVTVDGGDVYVAGKEFGLGPIAYEDSGRGEAKYYAVGVVKKSDTSTKFTELKGKKSCHTGVGRTAGWNAPIATLIHDGYIHAETGCDVVPAVGHFFSQSCAPGAKDRVYNPTGNASDALCALCKGEGENKCGRDDSEPYFGYTGAFRCLVEGGGDVAFINHLTVSQNTDGANKADWASGLKSEDFELLCPDGSRKSIKEATQCHIAKVPSHAVVTNVKKGEQVSVAFQRALLQLQYHFGEDNNPMVQLFASPPGFKDVLFQDATKETILLPPDQFDYTKYLGSYVATAEFLQSKTCNVVF